MTKTKDTTRTAVAESHQAIARIEARIEAATAQIASAQAAIASGEERLSACITNITDAEAAYASKSSDAAWSAVEAARSAKARAEFDLTNLRPLAGPFAATLADARRGLPAARETLRLAEIDAAEDEDETLRRSHGAAIVTNTKHWPLLLNVQGQALLAGGLLDRTHIDIGFAAQSDTAIRFDLSPQNTASTEALSGAMLDKLKRFADHEGLELRIECGHRAFAAAAMGTFKGCRDAVAEAKHRVIWETRNAAQEVLRQKRDREARRTHEARIAEEASSSYASEAEAKVAIEKAFDADLALLGRGAA